ncbi:HAD family hydrolase [Conchiformibius steedae DSM 2580]|uniref:3-deoxy-D-manno-octulosonate 8-phosphate phosphatase KdsC n=1 Tax=Conchiformibius steedae DSM 2580 TaxID=1121352 RepID=A0AAE9HVW1_9NEIS|nr:HAD family hydrolase [Conchiformibius steedae]QMT32742.1 HAD family hydrolase [Conchiformibius steedae]URD67352.1 HAD family hydrolase [Conchiformibius steedae DSM 2580]
MSPTLSDHLAQRAAAVRLLILDVDGVLTDGRLLMGANGEVFKAFHTLDGHGIKMLQQSGVAVAVITARNDSAVAARVQQLGIQHYFHGVHDKRAAYTQLREQTGLAEHQCAFAGDDVIDLPVLVRCGLPVAVANAHDFVKQHAVYTTQAVGGAGAVREVCDLLMRSQGTLDALLQEYLK